MTTVCSATPTRNIQRMFGPKTMTRRGHRNVSPRPTPSATRIIAGPMMCAACGASGSLRIGIGGSLPPARQTRSVPVWSSVTAPGPRSPGARSLSVTSIALPCSELRHFPGAGDDPDGSASSARAGRTFALLGRFAPPPSVVRPRSALAVEQTGHAGPAVLGREDLDRRLGRVRVGGDTALEEVLRGLLDLDVPGERGHDRLLDALALVFLDHLGDDLREGHRGRDDRVPVAQHERVDPLVLEAQPDGVGVGLGGLAAGDVDRVAGRAE